MSPKQVDQLEPSAELAAARQRIAELEAERVAAQLAQRASEARFGQLFDAALDPILLLDEAGLFVDCNAATLDLLRAPDKQTVLQHRPADLSPEFQPDGLLSTEKEAQLIALALQQGAYRFEWVHRRFDGSDFTVEVALKEIVVNGQSLLLVQWRDITDRKRIEQALRATTDELDRFFSFALDLLCIIDTEGCFRRLNRSWEQTLGFPLSELEGKRFIDLVHPDEQAATLAVLADLSANKPVLNFTNRYRSQNGEYRWIEWRAFPDENRLIYAAARDVTERRQMEDALRASETRYRLLADDAPLAVAVIDLATNDIVYVNQQTLKLFELTRAEALSSHGADRYVDLADRARLLEQMRATGRVTDFIAPFKTGTGRVRWLSLTCALTMYENRPAVHNSYIDVTDRLQAEAAEREQREMAEALRDTAAAMNSTLDFNEVLDRILANIDRVVPTDTANIMLLEDSPDGKIARVVRRRGYERISIELDQGVRVLRFLVRDVANLRNMLETGQPHIIYDTRADPDWVDLPGTRWQRSSLGMPILLHDKAVGFIHLDSGQPNFFNDQHAERLRVFANQAALAIQNAQLHEAVQRHAEELQQRVADRTAELAQERSRLQAILDSVDEAIYFMTPDRRIQYANAATSQVTGFDLSEIVGHSPAELWRSQLTSAEAIRSWEDALVTGLRWHGEVVNLRRDGRPYDTDLSIVPMRNSLSRLEGYVVVHRDLSQLKELDRLRSQFVNRIGHELRTPLTSLIIYLDLLEHGKPEKRAKYLQTLNTEADRLRRLVEGFIRLAELDTQPHAIELRPVNLSEVTIGLVMQHRERAIERQLSMEPQLAPDLPLVAGTAELITEAVSRVLDNALRYTPPGGHIALTTAQVEDDVTLTISDSGPGLSPADRSHLFERFYRGEAARDYKTPGVGLGLAICQSIMNRLGGRITVGESAESGASLTLWFKLAMGTYL